MNRYKESIRFLKLFINKHTSRVLNILEERGECYGQEIMHLYEGKYGEELPQTVASTSLRELYSWGLLERRAEGKYRYYTLKPGVLDKVHDQLGDLIYGL